MSGSLQLTRRDIYGAAVCAAALIGLAAIGVSRLDRPLTDYLLFNYTRITSMHDAPDGTKVTRTEDIPKTLGELDG